MTWIFLTLFATFMQAWRNAFQSQLSENLRTSAVTLARFIWAGPLAALYLYLLYYFLPTAIPIFPPKYWLYLCGAAVMQITATSLMVILFKMKNYAIGAGLAKSEAVVAAVLGVVFFGTTLSLTGWLGILLGAIAVFYLSMAGGIKSVSWPIVAIGLACGSSFAIGSLWIREACLSLHIGFPYSAAWVLLMLVCMQTLILLGYLLLRDKQTLKFLWQQPKLTVLTSVSSCLGAIAWISAMSIQNVPYVKTLGQIELFFTMLISVCWLKQKPKKTDILGLVLIAVAAVLVILA